MHHKNGIPLVQGTDSLEIAQTELVASLTRWTEKTDEPDIAIPTLVLRRHQEPTERTCYIYEPCICLIVQGSKRTLLGEDVYKFDAHHFLLISVDLPAVSQIIDARPEKPYLGLMLKFNQRDIAELMMHSELPSPSTQQTGRAIAIGEVCLSLLGAFKRLIDLLDKPKDIPILAPLIEKEILYRLLVGDQGVRLRQIATAGSQSQQVARAIKWLKDNFNQPLRVEDLATQVNMSKSTLHNHFRRMTAMSPLQYQKQLRLNEARRLLLMEHLDAADAAFQVGYESPSQFSREYSRLFGAPPLRDIENLRQHAAIN